MSHICTFLNWIINNCPCLFITISIENKYGRITAWPLFHLSDWTSRRHKWTRAISILNSTELDKHTGTKSFCLHITAATINFIFVTSTIFVNYCHTRSNAGGSCCEGQQVDTVGHTEACIWCIYAKNRQENNCLRLLKYAGNVLLAVWGIAGDVRAHFVALTNPEHACLIACMMAIEVRPWSRDWRASWEKTVVGNIVCKKTSLKRITLSVDLFPVCQLSFHSSKNDKSC